MPSNRPILRLGDSGPEVTSLQEDLKAVNCFAGVADGSFGQSTMDAVVLFQSMVGLIADGVVNEGTWSVLEGPEASVEDSIDIADFPGLALAVRHASDADVKAYLVDLGIDPEES
jgi:peptidoglycan hydrolase-like protein with peptidoglycan-binding domain